MSIIFLFLIPILSSFFIIFEIIGYSLVFIGAILWFCEPPPAILISLNSVYAVSLAAISIVPIIPVKKPRFPLSFVPNWNYPGSRSAAVFYELLLEMVVLPVNLRLLWGWTPPLVGGLRSRLIFPFVWIKSSRIGKSKRLILESSNFLAWFSLVFTDTMHV